MSLTIAVLDHSERAMRLHGQAMDFWQRFMPILVHALFVAAETEDIQPTKKEKSDE